MSTIRMRLVSQSIPLSTHGRIFAIVEVSGKKRPRLVPLDPVDVRLTRISSRQMELGPGEYAYIFHAQHDITPFEIIVEQWVDNGFVQIDVDKFDPKDPHDTFNMSNSFVIR